MKAQYLGAARQLWAALEADVQIVPGTGSQQPQGLVQPPRATRYLVRRAPGAPPLVPDTSFRETGLTRLVWDPDHGRLSALARVTTAPQYGNHFAILEVA